ncbi:MAG: hypothetical protein IE909_06020 [Campylobacterales bacterium]|nr:hypothetical protein [Campylobacterales bacterium]
MEKIKYLLILSLILTCGIFYVQLQEYKQISKTLLVQIEDKEFENNKLNNQIQELSTTSNDYKKAIENLNTIIDNKQNKIISLEENLSKMTIKNLIQNDINYTNEDLNYIITIPTFEQNNSSETLDIPLTPNIMLDENKQISGFELKYEQNF